MRIRADTDTQHCLHWKLMFKTEVFDENLSLGCLRIRALTDTQWRPRKGWGKGGNSAISVSADKILHKVCYVCPLSACLPAGWRLRSWLQLRN